MDDRNFQNGFETWDDSLSAIAIFKGVDRRTHQLDYVDLGEVAGDDV